MYERGNTSTLGWTLIGIFEGDEYYDEAGYSVAISADGSVIACGAPFNSDGGRSSGHVKVFVRVPMSSAGYKQIGDDIVGKATSVLGDVLSMGIGTSTDTKKITENEIVVNETCSPNFNNQIRK